MAEPENLVLELLRELRADMKRLEAKVDQGFAAQGERVETIEIKLDGLTHAVIAGFGSLVHEIDDVKQRLDRLERERA